MPLKLCILALLTAILASVEPAVTPSFADLARRAEAGETLTVVFLGGSLTWGANSTDPVRTSYRAHIARRLAARWPKAHWNCIDAAIGGTGSRLAVFRFARDVAAHKPDLVFLDHTVNDRDAGADPDLLASCEAVVRRCVADVRVPTLFMVLAAGDMVRGEIAQQPIRAAHLAIAKAYDLPVGDAVALIHDRLAAGAITHAEIWDNPKDGCHPGDQGYALYAEAGWTALEQAVQDGVRCAAPAAMLHADTYRTVARVPLAGLAPLPAGWRMGAPSRISAWYDSLMSRWLDSVVVAERAAGAPEPAAWELRFRGATVMLWGECTVTSGKLRVLIDGKPAPALKDGILDCRSGAGGTYKLDPTLAIGLEQGVEHILRLEPFDDRAGAAEWRIESVCVAGRDAAVVNIQAK